MSLSASTFTSQDRWSRQSDPKGEVLQYRRRTRDAPPVTTTAAGQCAVRISYGGQDYLASPEMAQCFLARAQRVLSDHDAQLVALLHESGPELLLIADHIPFQVGELFQHLPTTRQN
ncbi:MAG: hypothetical protein ABI238_02560 [Terrimesophilobacter sp.]